MAFDDFPKTMIEFERRFGDEAECWSYLRAMKWPNGFRCPSCAGRKSYFVAMRGRDECAACGKQTSVTVGTMFERIHKPLKVWFRAIFEFVASKDGCNACHLKRVLGISYATAWTWLHKIRDVFCRQDRELLKGGVEADETYVGGPAPGYRGRACGENQIPVAGVVEIAGEGCGRARLTPVETVGAEELQTFVGNVVLERAKVITDGLKSYVGLDGVFEHEIKVIGDPKNASKLFPRIHRVFSLFKRVLLGTYQGSWSKKWAALYCEEFTFRFNRRDSAHRTQLFRRVLEQAVKRAPRIHLLAGKNGPKRVLPEPT